MRDAKLSPAFSQNWMGEQGTGHPTANGAFGVAHDTGWVYLTVYVAKARYDLNPAERVLIKKKNVALSAYPCNLGVRVQADPY